MATAFTFASGQTALLFRPRPARCSRRRNRRSVPATLSLSTSGNGLENPETKAIDQDEAAQLGIQQTEKLVDKARVDLERLELMAESARLDSERAQILAERRRLELNKFKEKNETASPEEAVEAESESDVSITPADLKTYNINTSHQNSRIPLPTPLVLGVDFPQVDEKDIATIKGKICGVKTFFCTEVDRSPFSERVVFRGNLRIPPEDALEELEALAVTHGISDRVRLFLLLDPRDESADPKKPVLVALPADVMPNKPSVATSFLSALAALVTVNTTLLYGLGIFGVTPGFLEELADGKLEPVLATVPIAVGISLVALLHEAAHRIVADMRGVQLGLPFPIPSLQLGTYGTITPLESYPRRRADLFDVAVAGPLAGMVASFLALCAGLFLSTGGMADGFPQVPSSLFYSSFLVKILADSILSPSILEQATIAVHPLTIVGCAGIIVNSLNLFPVGRLDGGRMAQALFGRDTASRISGVTLFLQGLSTLFGNSPVLLFWGLICVFLQREADAPALNEIVEPDEVRTVLGCFLLLVPLLVLCPFPTSLGN